MILKTLFLPVLALIFSTNGFGQDDVQLKLAMMWGKIDELEIKIKKQEEKIKILEKGLMLGVIPEELLKDKLSIQAQPGDPMEWESKKETHYEIEKKLEESGIEKQAPIHDGRSSNEKQLPAHDGRGFNEIIKDAQKMFGEGKYGQAITLYQKVEVEFPSENNEGQSYYWVGLSWYYLKEYDLSEKSLTKLIEKSPDSPWVPSSRFYLAKGLVKRDLHSQALQEFSKLIELYPGTDTSEMSQREIKLIRESI